MLLRARWRSLESALLSSPSISFRPPTSQFLRPFSVCAQCLSKIGQAPLSIPPGVEFQVLSPAEKPSSTTSFVSPTAKTRTRQWHRIRRGLVPKTPKSQLSTVHVKGPLGEMAMTIPPYMSITRQGEDGTTGPAIISVEDSNIRKQREMWGTVRAYLANHIMGVSEGHTAILRLVGVGYRASVESSATTKEPQYPGQQFVSLKVGYSHPIELGVPKGVKASCPQPTRILLEGVEREVVMQFAAHIRQWRVPEPYKGKGIFVNDETIRLKSKKIK